MTRTNLDCIRQRRKIVPHMVLLILMPLVLMESRVTFFMAVRRAGSQIHKSVTVVSVVRAGGGYHLPHPMGQ